MFGMAYTWNDDIQTFVNLEIRTEIWDRIRFNKTFKTKPVLSWATAPTSWPVLSWVTAPTSWPNFPEWVVSPNG